MEMSLTTVIVLILTVLVSGLIIFYWSGLSQVLTSFAAGFAQSILNIVT